jgi:hypothetical protein
MWMVGLMRGLLLYSFTSFQIEKGTVCMTMPSFGTGRVPIYVVSYLTITSVYLDTIYLLIW